MVELDRYLAGIGICLFMLIPYVCFRTEVVNGLYEQGIRHRRIYHHMEGFFNFFWLLGLAKSYGCVFASVLSVLFTVLFPMVTLYHAGFGWWEEMPLLVDYLAVGGLSLITTILTAYTVIRRNLRLFNSPFVVLASLHVRNVRGKFFNTAHYSVVLDLICIFAPVGISSIMYFL